MTNLRREGILEVLILFFLSVVTLLVVAGVVSKGGTDPAVAWGRPNYRDGVHTCVSQMVDALCSTKATEGGRRWVTGRSG